ncbi:GPW/gp25 family protein [Vibrio sp. EA2]|uniref:GPW/gp25 family protein n=1 Tax=Vibrio sp. EA2 TaxID=3079860 RepID=UPI00294A6F77|nr:GPW/gp25 family protein [Vibrio sp. EA2]MDV6250466.1 GPW/gp25 family protein [Vibrio sp. EA2]
MSRLNQPDYTHFPLQLGHEGGQTTQRIEHIRQKIEQVLFTEPGERWFRPEFGAGVGSLIFEPQSTVLWQITKQRLQSSLVEALRGEVSPKDLAIEVSADPDFAERLIIQISYRLTALNHSETLEFEISGGLR